MPPQPSITLTDPEVDLIRRALLHAEHQMQDLEADAQPVPVIISRIGEAVAGIRYLLDRAEHRRKMN